MIILGHLLTHNSKCKNPISNQFTLVYSIVTHIRRVNNVKGENSEVQNSLTEKTR